MSVLGSNFLLWCFPCNRDLEGEGLQFEVREELKPKSPKAPNEQDEKQTSNIEIGDDD